MSLERATIEGNSPVNENGFMLLDTFLDYSGARKPWRKQARLSGQG